MKYDVFISYSTKDQKVSDKVCAYLEERGLKCFIASRNIPKGAEWPSAIAEALKSSRLFLAVFSNNYNLSMQVNKELTIASKRRIPLLTFKTTEDDFEGTKDYFLSEVNFIIAYPNPENALKPLYESVSAIVKGNAVPGEESSEAQLSFTYQEDKERAVRELLSQKPKDSQKRLELAKKLAQYKEWQPAFYWFDKAAQKDDREAIFHLAECYQKGLGTDADLKHAVELYEKAYGLGYIHAANHLGHIYYAGGPGLEVDYKLSLQWYERALSDECPETYKDLADYYSEGKACVPEESKEFLYRKKYYEYHFYNALENECVESMCIVGSLCEEGKGVDQNDAYAMAWYTRAAKGGSCKAKYRLGEMHERGIGVAVDKEKAFAYMQEASSVYDVAMVKLGDYYRKGIGTSENPHKAFECYLLAAATNNPVACYNVGECYAKAIGTSQRSRNAEEYYKRASNLGYVKALGALGRLQFKLGNKEEGLANLEMAAQQNDYLSLYRLGEIYGGDKEFKDLEKALSYLKRASEVNEIEGEALTIMGRIYTKPGELCDEKKAYECFVEGAKRGHHGSMRSLADCFVQGKGVEPDDFQAFTWASKSVEAGNKRALNTLGEYYRFGIGTKKNPEKAIECYKEYYDSGRGVLGLVNIGEMYFNGEGVPVDYDEATKWFQMACDSRMSTPYVFIGRMYEMGVYGEKNVSQAISWFKKGEQLGSPYAVFYLGQCYANDEILPEPETAVQYYLKAAEAGLMEAKYELAKCYLGGIGTEENPENAYMLFKEIADKWFEMRKTISSYVVLAKAKSTLITTDRQTEMKKPLYADAMFNLGKCYVDGLGTQANIPEGMKWITIATKLGHEEAADYRVVYK